MTVYETNLPFRLIARGKVRDVYETPEGILLVATDRLSAFDVVFPDPIPRKGEVLNQLGAYWFRETHSMVPNHLKSINPIEALGLTDHSEELAGRCSLCHAAQPFPVECVVRGYLEGSAWTDYQRDQTVSGVRLPAGLERRARLPHPIFTPSTKAESGHDMPISFAKVVKLIGVDAAEFIRARSLELYHFAHAELLNKDILLSDTKFEFGMFDGEIILIDEALTPDSSRFWEAEPYLSGKAAVSYDKQYLRDYVEASGWNKTPPAPKLPSDVIGNLSARYLEIFRLITGRTLDELENDQI
ncbi:phosphoribosylaminoimidazolesuccinocarboxamide synthase [candidate division BRC1 bacterium HGW-BRC1-1]|jgi:phosphoribosylaminoimidazole-succinocarboxamide synthase|nr:MAG: phosphoribosylaminoimidazolesuccinocarboxamide synthase [candidate division BRC1 bacterium HGW-BRC1-1]